MRIITFNANGIRSAAKKGFFSWFATQNADILCVQETKAQSHQLTDDHFTIPGYQSYFFDAEKKGYSGVALYSRHTPDKVHLGLGWPTADVEGRYIQADFGHLSVASLYLPSGCTGEIRQAVKYDFLDRYEALLKKQNDGSREYILCGDWNIAHQNIDIKNWKSNQKTSGFLPEERSWLDKLFGSLGYVDAFRVLNQEPDQYTWWSERARAWAKNVGWRIDYQIITKGLVKSLVSTHIYREEKFSDHAPLTVDYNISL